MIWRGHDLRRHFRWKNRWFKALLVRVGRTASRPVRHDPSRHLVVPLGWERQGEGRPGDCRVLPGGDRWADESAQYARRRGVV